MKKLLITLFVGSLCLFFVDTSANIALGDAECAAAGDEVYSYYVGNGYSLEDAGQEARDYYDACMMHNPE